MDIKTFESYEKCIKEHYLTKMEGKVQQMADKFDEYTDLLSKNSDDENFYQSLIN